LQGREDRTGDQILTNEVFRAMHVILSLKLGDHEGLTLFVHGRLLKRTLLIVLPAILIQIPIRVFLSPVPVYCSGQSGTAWWCLAAAGRMPLPGTQLRETQYRFCIFCIISLIIISSSNSSINVISKTFYIQFVSLSPFSSFSLPLVGGRGDNGEQLSLSLLTPCFKPWHRYKKEIISCESGESPEQVAHTSCGCCLLVSVQGEFVCGFEQSGLAEGVPARGWGVGTMRSIKSLPTQTIP